MVQEWFERLKEVGVLEKIHYVRLENPPLTILQQGQRTPSNPNPIYECDKDCILIVYRCC